MILPSINFTRIMIRTFTFESCTIPLCTKFLSLQFVYSPDLDLHQMSLSAFSKFEFLNEKRGEEDRENEKYRERGDGEGEMTALETLNYKIVQILKDFRYETFVRGLQSNGQKVERHRFCHNREKDERAGRTGFRHEF
ncbi:hypothetical protein Hdeb2414_s0005g00174411 [Helianthus debilis subsp. tardiflorus]